MPQSNMSSYACINVLSSSRKNVIAFSLVVLTAGKTSEGRALRASRQGDESPWIPVFVGWGWGKSKSLPRWYFLRGRSPAYPFFRKEKNHPHRRRRDYDADSPERASATLILSAGRGFVRRTESPSQGYRLAAASLPAPFNKGAEPTLCVYRRSVHS